MSRLKVLNSPSHVHGLVLGSRIVRDHQRSKIPRVKMES